MKRQNALFAAALFAGIGAAGLAAAQAQSQPADAGAAHGHARLHVNEHLMPGQLVEGRIAFLKAELKITPAQEAQWQQVGTAMRENAKALDQAITAARQNREAQDVVQRLEARQQFAKLHADNGARLLAAVKPLYASLSPDQQQLANRLMAMAMRQHEGHHHP